MLGTKRFNIYYRAVNLNGRLCDLPRVASSENELRRPAGLVYERETLNKFPPLSDTEHMPLTAVMRHSRAWGNAVRDTLALSVLLLSLLSLPNPASSFLVPGPLHAAPRASARAISGGRALRCAAASPAEQYAAQRAAMLQEKQEEHVKQAFEEKLGAVGDQAHLLDKEFWRALAGGHGLSIADAPSDATLTGISQEMGPETASPHDASTTPEAMQSRENLKLLLDRGFCGVEGVDWDALGVDFPALARTMDALKAAGFLSLPKPCTLMPTGVPRS